MDAVNISHRNFFCAGLFFLTAAGSGAGLLAQTTDGSRPGSEAGYVSDCTDVSVEYEDDPSLTAEERLTLMEQSFYRSLNKFDLCHDASSNSNGVDAGAGGANGTGDSDSGDAEGTSTATSDMSGTEGTSAEKSSEGTAVSISSEISGAESDTSTPASVNSDGQTEGNEPLDELDGGSTPEDIPSADNDSVLEAQIRQAAINETDPDVKARLWNEYRKYKGLPQVN